MPSLCYSGIFLIYGKFFIPVESFMQQGDTFEQRYLDGPWLFAF